MSDIIRKLVTVRTVNDILPIPKADAIEIAVVDGWKVVAKKGEFVPGSLCVYFEIDSFLPESDSTYSFLMKSGVRTFEGVRGHKLRTIKLRGQISQGLIFPLHVFNEHTPVVKHFFDNPPKNGDDLTDLLGIKKWEPTLAACLAGQVEGLFPSFIRKTDQERCQNIGSTIFGYEDTYADLDVTNIPVDAIEKLIARGECKFDDDTEKYVRVYKATASPDDQYEVTMKLDGTSVTCYKMDGRLGVCSRNLELKVNEENKDNSLVKMFVDSMLKSVLDKMGENIAIQGELMGPGIQGNREGFSTNKFFIFDVQDLETGTYYTPKQRADLIADLHGYGVDDQMVQHVPIIAHAAKLGDTLGITDVTGLLKLAEGKSINHPVREGLVFKRVDGKFSFKAISNAFLEKNDD